MKKKKVKYLQLTTIYTVGMDNIFVNQAEYIEPSWFLKSICSLSVRYHLLSHESSAVGFFVSFLLLID